MAFLPISFVYNVQTSSPFTFSCLIALSMHTWCLKSTCHVSNPQYSTVNNITSKCTICVCVLWILLIKKIIISTYLKRTLLKTLLAKKITIIPRQSSTGNSESTASLSAFACHVLREICSQQWVLERCLCHPEELCHNDNLLDPLLSHSQAQRLLHMICYPDASSTIDELDQKSMITRILEVFFATFSCRSVSTNFFYVES